MPEQNYTRILNRVEEASHGGDVRLPAAIHFSFGASCRRHNLDAFAYLRDVFTRLPLLGPDAPPEQLRDLLPDRWRPNAGK